MQPKVTHLNLAQVLMGFLALINVSFTARRVIQHVVPIMHRDTYSYTGTDFPPVHPSLPLRPASLTFQETVRYGPNGSDPVSFQEWDSIQKHPSGLGRAILGPEHREFLVTFYHQLHCIREIQRGLVNIEDEEATPHHMKHCFDYLRQTMLCSAMDTLEEGDFVERDWEMQRRGGEVACWDWEAVYASLGKGWEEFKQWRDTSSVLA